ncbi:hypothetical protein [Parafrankia elaeagni]|uniref:hypothetical protein n=1 Tax=Parafrankia elaeagni TaxID=222534 RepID=UPI00037D5BDF|nr:hypothetical protein [Parafrankia elaeagni]
MPIDDIIVRRPWQARSLTVEAERKAVLFRNEIPVKVLTAGRRYSPARGLPFSADMYVIEFDMRKTWHQEVLRGLRLEDGDSVDVAVEAWVGLQTANEQQLSEWVTSYNLLSMPKDTLLRREFRRRFQEVFGRLDRSQVMRHAYDREDLWSSVRPGGSSFLCIHEIVDVTVLDDAVALADREGQVERTRLRHELARKAERLRVLIELAREQNLPLHMVDEELAKRFRAAVETLRDLYSVGSNAFVGAFRELVAHSSGIGDLATEHRQLVPWLMSRVEDLVPNNILASVVGSMASGEDRGHPPPPAAAAAAGGAGGAGGRREAEPAMLSPRSTAWRPPNELRMTPPEARLMVRGLALPHVVGCCVASPPTAEATLYLVSDDPDFLAERIRSVREHLLRDLAVTDVVVLAWCADPDERLPEWCRGTSRVAARAVSGRRDADGSVVLSAYDGNGRSISDELSLLRLRTFTEVVRLLSGEDVVRIDTAAAA